MIEPPVPDDEEKRLALLRACNIIYTPAEEAFDDVARLAADICGTEIALITLVDADYHQLVTGDHPFRGNHDLQLFASVMTKPPIPIRPHLRESVPAVAEAVLFKCLRRPRGERFESMTELATALRSAMA